MVSARCKGLPITMNIEAEDQKGLYHQGQDGIHSKALREKKNGRGRGEEGRKKEVEESKEC